MSRSELTKRQSDNVRANMARQASQVGNRLIACAMGEIELSPTQVKSAQIILDKTVPTLQSVDSTVVTDQASMTESQAMERLTTLLQKHPEIANIIRGKGIVVEPEKEAITHESTDSAGVPVPDGMQCGTDEVSE